MSSSAQNSSKPDYEKVRAGKVEAMRRFKESLAKAKAEGTITYKKI